MLLYLILLSYFQFRITTAMDLRLSEVSPGRLQGRFSTKDGEIEFDSIVTKNHHHSFSILTTEGTNLVSSTQHHYDGPMSISLFNEKYILAKDQSKMDEYLVPERLHKHVDSALRNKWIMSLLQKEFETNPIRSREAAISRLILSREANLVIEAAKAVGNRGIIGKDNPAAMRLYILAMRLQNLITPKQASSNENLDDERLQQFGQTMAHNKEYCTKSKNYCEKGKCPGANSCEGMCGPSCSCWKWVCGNCCWNKMCYDHDQCCRKKMLSWGCMGIIFKGLFAYCDKPYSC